MEYLAKTKDGKDAFFLSKDTQMEKFMSMGFNIYASESDDTEDILIATPEEGFLVDRPTFPVAESNSAS